MTTKEMADDVPESALKPYGLNEDQVKAFQHLWRYGPVGLLQGPPGTGKTLFIAAFVHYALNKGQLRNVLVLSQSHEAVNTAAEEILKIAVRLGGQVDLLRIGQHLKISAPLQRYHSRAIQDRHRELFRAEIKDRLAAPASRLGLNKQYVREAVEIEATYGAIVRQIEACQSDIASSEDEDVVDNARQRLQTMRSAFYRLVQEDITPRDGEPEEILNELRDEAARRHGLDDFEARSNLVKLEALSRSWIAALTGKHRDLEEFLARSRNLICGTCVGIGRYGIRLDRRALDLVIIDEAARCTPGELAVGMQSANRILLVGDHRQLPPLVGHELMRSVGEQIGARSRTEMTRSDFERAFGSAYGQSIARTLRKQYRMASEIGKLVSEVFYPDESLEVARAEPAEHYSLLPNPLDRQTVWIDMGFQRTERADTSAGTSYINRREAAAIIDLLRGLSRCTSFLEAAGKELREGEHLVGVICTYAQQAELVDDMLLSSDVPESLRRLTKVDTVDAYQGKQNRIVVLSLVRNNPERNMGHVRSKNRINVALSRAMDRLVIIGSAKMFDVGNNPLYQVLQRMRAGHRVRPASDLQVM